MIRLKKRRIDDIKATRGGDALDFLDGQERFSQVLENSARIDVIEDIIDKGQLLRLGHQVDVLARQDIE